MVGGSCDFETVYKLAVPNPHAEDGSGRNGGRAGELTYDSPTTRFGSNFCDDNPTLRRDGADGENGGSGLDGVGGHGCG